jgi:hypothetical protein
MLCPPACWRAGRERGLRPWLRSTQVNGGNSDGLSSESPVKRYEKRQNTRIRREKCTPKIPVNGFILARVHQESKPEVEAERSSTTRKRAAPASFSHVYQWDRPILKLPQGAMGYD